MTRIVGRMFNNCNSLISVTIPSSVTSIGDFAFGSCSSLTNVTIPSKVTSIGDGAFGDCESLTSIIIPFGVTSIGDDAFVDCDSLTSVAIPDSVTSIGDGAFDNCYNLMSMTIPSSVTSIGDFAFGGCRGLKNITIPSNVTSIGDGAFYDCFYLTSVTILSKAARFGKDIFKYSYGSSSAVVIKGYAGSTAQTYANDNHFTFISLDGIIDTPFTSNGQYNLKIIDSKTKNAITGATVTCQGNCFNSGTLRGDYTIKVTNATPSTEVTISKENYASHTMTLNDLDTHSLSNDNVIELVPINGEDNDIGNINLNEGKTKVDGPTLDIGPWSFPIFEIDAGINAGPIEFQKKVDPDRKKVSVLFGVNANTSDWSDTYDTVKSVANAFGKTTAQDFENKFNKINDKLISNNMDMGVECEGSLFGYAEYSYASGEKQLTESDLIFRGKVAGDLKYHIAETGGLVYLHLKLTATESGKLGLKVVGTNLKDPKLVAELEFAINMKLGLGAGDDHVISIEGGLEGELGTKVALDQSKSGALKNDLTVTGTFGIYYKGCLFKYWEVSDSFTIAKHQFYPQVTKSQSINLSDYSSYKPVSRDYLKDGGTLSTNSVTGDYTQDSVYPYGDPKIVKLADGRLMAFWIGDNGSKSISNRTTLMYAIRAADGYWGQAQAVSESGRADLSPVVCAEGNNCYVLWHNASEQLADDVDLTTMATKMNLEYSMFDGTNFSQPIVVSNQGNGKMQQLPTIDAKNGKVTISWLENSDNEPYMATGTNTFYARTLTGSNWSAIQPLNTNIGYLSSTAIAGDSIYYSKDADGDPSTTGDSEIYKIESSGTPTPVQLTSDTNDDTAVKNIDGTIYWNKEGKLIAYDGLAINETGADCSDNYDVLTSGTEQTVLHTQKNGYSSEIYITKKAAGDSTWSNSVPYTKYNGMIRTFDSTVDNTGNIITALDKVAVNANAASGTNPYGNTDFVITGMKDRYDLAVDPTLYYDTAQATAGSTVTLSAKVTNSSTQPVTQLKVTQLDANNNVIKTETVSQTIAVGAEADVTTQYILPDPLTNQKMSVKLEPVGVTDDDATNNIAACEFGFSNITVTNTSFSRGTTGGTLTATVSNNGVATANNVKANVYQNGTKGTQIGSTTVGTLAPGATKDLTFDITETQLKSSDDYDGKLFTLQAVTDSQESQYDDDTADINVDALQATNVTLNQSEVSMKAGTSQTLKATLSPSNAANIVQWVSDNTEVATVDQNGRVIAIGNGTAHITAIAGERTAWATITVTGGESVVKVTNITLDKDSLTLKQKETYTLKPAITPVNATNQELTWASSNPAIATVSNSGVVRGAAAGTVAITCTAKDGSGKFASCTVTVTDEIKQFPLGDIDEDDKINASDALQALRHSVKEITLEGDAFTRGDVTKDKTINASDALQILRYSVKEIDRF